MKEAPANKDRGFFIMALRSATARRHDLQVSDALPLVLDRFRSGGTVTWRLIYQHEF